MPDITLFARHEESTDQLYQEHRKKDPDYAIKNDVVLYYDRGCTRLAGRHPYYFTASIPKRSHKFVTLNCARWKLVWVD